MTIGHLLIDFNERMPPGETSVTRELEDEDRLDVFEQGYQAGWEDATKAAGDQGAKTATEISSALRDSSLTYGKAYNDVLTSLQPVLHEMVSCVLPEIAQATLGFKVCRLIQEHASSVTEQKALVYIPATQGDMVKSLLKEVPDLCFEVRELNDLPPGEARIEFGKEEQVEVSTTDLISQITSELRDFFQSEVCGNRSELNEHTN